MALLILTNLTSDEIAAEVDNSVTDIVSKKKKELKQQLSDPTLD